MQLIVIVFNTTFNYISVISWLDFFNIDGGNRRKPQTCRKSLKKLHIHLYIVHVT